MTEVIADQPREVIREEKAMSGMDETEETFPEYACMVESEQVRKICRHAWNDAGDNHPNGPTGKGYTI